MTPNSNLPALPPNPTRHPTAAPAPGKLFVPEAPAPGAIVEAPAPGTLFKKTDRQKAATRLHVQKTYIMLEGGSRSGKTFISLRNIFVRAMLVKSRHLVARFRFNHIKASIVMDTLPKMMALCFPDVPYKLDKTDYYVKLPNGSEVWFAGLDDALRLEKVLGNEYSTIYLNETSQISYEAVTICKTRLAENSGLVHKMYFDCNPPSKAHWSYVVWHKRLDPETKEPIPDADEYGSLAMNPRDNLENLPAKYLKILEGLPKKARARFLEGLYGDNTEGALWDDASIELAIAREPDFVNTTVISVDPATTDNPGSDECGIVVCSRDDTDGGIVEADISGKMSTGRWAARVVEAYHYYEANFVVAEVNQGGDLVKDAIHAVDPTVKVITVHASKSKKARAEPVAALYEPEQARIHHREHFHKLEEEMTTWVPLDPDGVGAKWSPNRLDALVWGFTFLFFPDQKKREEVRSLVIAD